MNNPAGKLVKLTHDMRKVRKLKPTQFVAIEGEDLYIAGDGAMVPRVDFLIQKRSLNKINRMYGGKGNIMWTDSNGEFKTDTAAVILESESWYAKDNIVYKIFCNGKVVYIKKEYLEFLEKKK